MKTSIVPAQITTVEDKIFGSLSMQQLVLLVSPFFLGFVAFIILPPNLQFVLYKFGVIGVLFVVCGLLAIRIKGKLLIFWIGTIAQYNTRPRYYVYDKTDQYLRDEPEVSPQQDKQKIEVTSRDELPQMAVIDTADRVKFEEIMRDPRAQFKFRAGKDGKLNVIIKEIK